MPEEADAEEVMRLALMPIGARKHLQDGGQLRVVARDAGAHHDPQRFGGVKVIINHFHLPLSHPIDAGDGVQRQALFIKLLGGEHDLVRSNGRLNVIPLGRIIDPVEREWNVRERVRQDGCRHGLNGCRGLGGRDSGRLRRHRCGRRSGGRRACWRRALNLRLRFVWVRHSNTPALQCSITPLSRSASAACR
jgi:hypothetical protein